MISSDILKSVDSAAYTVMVILELISAFGTVDDSILINRLLGFALKWFKSFWQKVRCFCKPGDARL